MRKVLFILSCLNDEDVDWLVEHGARQSLPAGAVLIREGAPLTALYLLLVGQLSVRAASQGNREVNSFLPGSLTGEMSFLDSSPPSASVSAVTDSVVLAIPRRAIQEKLNHDPSFGARFYRALGMLLAHRLRQVTLSGFARTTHKTLNPDEVEEDEIDEALLDAIALGAKRFEHVLQRLSAGRAAEVMSMG
jgi:CRP-like cAMP-binding protein